MSDVEGPEPVDYIVQGMTNEDIRRVEAVRAAYTRQVLEIYERVKAELEQENEK